MKLGDVAKEWGQLLTMEGPGRTVDAIREAMLWRGLAASSAIRVLELLLTTASPKQSKELIEEILNDARRLRELNRTASVGGIRALCLEEGKQRLEIQLAQRMRGEAVDPILQGHIVVAEREERELKECIIRMNAENSRIEMLLKHLGEE